MSMFKLVSSFRAIPPQKEAAKKLLDGLKAGYRFQTLLGVTGSGKTFVMSQIIEAAKRPALVISHNKTLGAQLYQEFKEFFPNNAVHYFVSYYDYYQPEAYIPQTDTYIEKDAKINEEIDRLRHAAIQDVLSRNDVIIVASVSCIYNIGDPEAYKKVSLFVQRDQHISQKNFLQHLVSLGYARNDADFRPGTFRVRGNRIEIFIISGQEMLTLEFSKNKVVSLAKRSPDFPFGLPKIFDQIISKNGVRPPFRNSDLEIKNFVLYPAHFWVTEEERLHIAIQNIRLELQKCLLKLAREGKRLEEGNRLEKRTLYDLSMIGETGYCHGIENYSRHLAFRKPGEPPFTLLDYFDKNLLVFIDESHMTVPQLRGMLAGDRARKETLIEHGFRLPSAKDNRPLSYEEFLEKTGRIIFVSATPNEYEHRISSRTVELLVRPTGLLEPSIEIRPTKNQLHDAVGEIKKRIEKHQRVLVTTITKRLAEDLAEHLRGMGMKAHYLHSEINTLERPPILNDLREGKYDVVVGINLLREGLDLPEVSLIIIFDADKEGFLRSQTTFLQTMGRAARHPEGHAIMYADGMTSSMRYALREAKRRRSIQEDYNKKHTVVPKGIHKKVRQWVFPKKQPQEPLGEMFHTMNIRELTKEMRVAARNLDFEKAAAIRDLIQKLAHK